MADLTPDIEESCELALENAFQKESFASLKEFLKSEMKINSIYPPGAKIFSAFNLTPLTAVKVDLLGQDPYHGPGQAHGLAFSV